MKYLRIEHRNRQYLILFRLNIELIQRENITTKLYGTDLRDQA